MALEAQDNPFPYVTLTETADPSTPAANTQRLWLDTDGVLKVIDEADVVTPIISASGAVGTDAIWDAAGDLAVGSGANTAAKMAMGTALQTLRVNSGATGLEYAATLGAWTDYTPTWAASGGGFVLGSSTLLGRFKLLDSKTGIFRVNLTITTGGAFAVGTGTWTVTLPSGWTTPNDGRIQVVDMHINDASTGHYAGVAKILPNDTKTTELHAADDAAPRVVDHNSPVTWATGDTIDIMGIIEIA